jgi:1-acyl-sn-glycerol-3-phosphate acyltransferase
MQSMSGEFVYWVLRAVLDVTVWGGELIRDTELRRSEPAIYVANHAGALGPIAVICSLPVRLHPWVIADMVDSERAGPYLRKDFFEDDLRLSGSWTARAALLLSRVSLGLLRGIGSIPVWQDRDLLETYRLSDAYLAQDRSLLIFPEDPQLLISARTGMRPFKTGFAHLGSMHYARTQRCLKFYPMAVQTALRRARLGEPVVYDPLNGETAERKRIARALENIISEMLATHGGMRDVRVGETR